MAGDGRGEDAVIIDPEDNDARKESQESKVPSHRRATSVPPFSDEAMAGSQ